MITFLSESSLKILITQNFVILADEFQEKGKETGFCDRELIKGSYSHQSIALFQLYRQKVI